MLSSAQLEEPSPSHRLVCDFGMFRRLMHLLVSWEAAQFDNLPSVELEPSVLWGSHEPQRWLVGLSRELGVEALQAVQLSPSFVCVASCERNRLKSALRALTCVG